MKKSILILSAFVIAALAFNGCKKGAEDPFITLKSRDGRLTKTWKLTSIEGTEVTTNTSGTVTTIKTTTTTYNGSAYSEASVTTGGPTGTINSTTTGTGTYEMTIDKHGKVTIVETFTSGSSTVTNTIEGTWLWLSSNKNRDHLYIDGGKAFFPGGNMYVERLAGKELVLHNVTKSSDNTGDSETSDIKYTFSK